MNNRNKIMIKITQILVFFMVYFLNCIAVYSANSIINVKIAPLNRLTIYFDSLTVKFSSSLSDDKKSIFIDLPSTNLNTQNQKLTSSGVINSVELLQSGTGSRIKINLMDKRGYNAVILPYSKAMMIEVFQWDRLSMGEDKFRTGLLGYEDKINTASKEDLLLAVKDKVPNSATFLAFIYLKEGKLRTALKLLQFDEYLQSNIIDNFACQSEIYRIIGDNNKSNYYQNKFKDSTGFLNFSNLSTQINSIEDSLEISKFGFIDSILSVNNIVKQDSIQAASKKDTITLKETKPVEVNSNLVPYWEYILFGLFALAISIIYLYLKWRNKKLNQLFEMSKTAKKSISKTEIENNKPIQKKITDIYKKNQAKEQPEPEKANKKESETTEQKANYNIGNLINTMKQIEQEKKIAHEEHIKGKTEDDTLKRSKYSAKVELAMNIADEQKKIKSDSLDELNKIQIPSETEKLTEISKKLGIERGGLETKKTIEKLLKDEKFLEDLRNKFNEK